ncbi:MAG: hypothetical protein BWY31_03422 [Lentisphaerae bacterium ADurb.Bin242]|nr:MAG: hypothetical protein BWY31_03422 [Lentisphaerae bacterium ADurb.Bin242]
MRALQKKRERIDYKSSARERRRLTQYLHAGRFQRSGEKSLEAGVRTGRMIFCLAAALVVLTGCLFVIF